MLEEDEEKRTDESGDEAEEEEPWELGEAGEIEIGHCVEKTDSKKGSGNHGRNYRGKDDGAEIGHGKIAENDLAGEDGARDRGVIGGSHAGSSAASDEEAEAVGGPFEKLSTFGGEGGGGLGDGAFASDGSAGADADDGGERFDECAANAEASVSCCNDFDNVVGALVRNEAEAPK